MLGVAKERVRIGGRLNGVDGHLYVAGCAIFESHWTRNAGYELAVHLALRSARADGSPAYQAGNVLRRNHVEELCAGGNTHFREVDQQVPRLAQAVVDLVRLVKIRVVDQALPADGGAGLLKINAHDDAQVVGVFRDGVFEQRAVFACSLGVVDGAGPDQDKQPGIAPGEDLSDLMTRCENGLGGGLGNGELLFEEDRRQNHLGPLNVYV